MNILITISMLSALLALSAPLRGRPLTPRTAAHNEQLADTAHTPPKGSPEREAIVNALRGQEKVIFKVHYLKVHRGWAWIDVTPLDERGQAVAEGGPSLMRLDNGRWKVMDLSALPEDPNDPLEAETASPGYVAKIRKAFPGVPVDIFPEASRPKRRQP